MKNKKLFKIETFEELVESIEKLGFKTKILLSEHNRDKTCIFAKKFPIKWGNGGYQIKEHNYLDKPYFSFCSRQCLEIDGHVEYISFYHEYNNPTPQKIFEVFEKLKECINE